MESILRKSEAFSPEAIFELSLSNRSLTKLPVYIEQLSHLVVLNLSENLLTDFALAGLTHLKQLDLSSNRIRFFALSSLPRLEVLRLQDNHIDSLDTLRSGLTGIAGSLEILSLRQNPVCYLEAYDAETRKIMPRLTCLDGERIGSGLADVTRTIRDLHRVVAERLQSNFPVFQADDVLDAVNETIEFVQVNDHVADLMQRMDLCKTSLLVENNYGMLCFTQGHQVAHRSSALQANTPNVSPVQQRNTSSSSVSLIVVVVVVVVVVVRQLKEQKK